MKRKIVISIPTADEEVRIEISPTGENTVVITSEVPKFAVSSDELKEALDECERYRLEFLEKEGPAKLETSEKDLVTPIQFGVEYE